MGGSSKTLNCCSSAAVTAITQFITDLVLLGEESIKFEQPFLRTSQFTSFGARFRNYGQYSTYTFINT